MESKSRIALLSWLTSHHAMEWGFAQSTPKYFHIDAIHAFYNDTHKVKVSKIELVRRLHCVDRQSRLNRYGREFMLCGDFDIPSKYLDFAYQRIAEKKEKENVKRRKKFAYH